MSTIKDQITSVRHTPANITELGENEIFVFGSNEAGNHAGGAAHTAVEKFGAVMGQGEGLQGHSYAIPTMEGLGLLEDAVARFLEFAASNQYLTFLVTAIGTGIAKHKVEDIAPLFAFRSDNVIIPTEFDVELVLSTFKGLNQNLTCREFQYEIGKEHEHEGNVRACNSGFHACLYPLDTFSYYAPNKSRYAATQQYGALALHTDDSKVASQKLKISAEIGLQGIITAAAEYTMKRARPIDPNSPSWNSAPRGAASNSGDYGAASNSGTRGAASNSGYQGAASNSGCQGVASNSGYQGAASNSGYQGAASNSGYQGATSNSGDCGAASNSGTRGAASNSGHCGAASNSGTRGAASNSGDYGAASNSGTRGAASNSGYQGAASNSGCQGVASNSGYQGAASNSGEHGVAMACGGKGRVMGSLGTVLFLVERSDEGETLNAWHGIVGRNGIKPDTWYRLEGGAPVEVNVED